GSFRDPNELGSGGGADSDFGGNGGGLVRMTVNTLNLEGQILAHGGNGTPWGGGGSGGGIKITSGTISGGGLIRANGGTAGTTQPGGGGGGRIAIYYTDGAAFDFANVQAVGGQIARQAGTAGTIYFESTATPLGELIVHAFGTNVPTAFTPLLSLAGGSSTALEANRLTDTNASFIPGGLIGLRLQPDTGTAATFRIVGNTTNTIVTDPADGPLTSVATVGGTYFAELGVGHLALRGGAKVDLVDGDRLRPDRRGRLHARTVEILGGSWLSHPESSDVFQTGLELVVDDALTIDATSRVDVTGRGYLGARRPGNNVWEGRTLGNTSVGGSTRRNGGSYGGSGGIGTAGGTANALYGQPEDPNEPGSGGGADSDFGGHGGGLIRIVARNVTLNGQLVANGGAGTPWGGGGSGGGIKLTAETLGGAGSLSAHGGDAGSTQPGGGGGGRVAVLYQTLDGFPLANVLANGGTAWGAGANGSLFLQQLNYVSPPALTNPSRNGFVGFTSIQLFGSPNLISANGHSLAEESVTLEIRWQAPDPERYVIEMSHDLVHWTPVTLSYSLADEGGRLTRLAHDAGRNCFLRLRLKSTAWLGR
ncbi:MAG TPA: hypothetical protein DCY13_01400, partial [Verrucomicrobiales bacterium]|nr:hypothetical protein [Verrucomicrobiales bacterium]